MKRNGLFVRTSLVPVPGGTRLEREICFYRISGGSSTKAYSSATEPWVRSSPTAESPNPPARHRFELDAHDLDVASGGERDRSGYLETRSRVHSSARRGSTARETDKASHREGIYGSQTYCR